jgi:formate hydrogenlyase subunit 4
MGLIRTILALVILLILVHVALVYLGVEQGANVLTAAVYSLGKLLESPVAFLLNTITALQRYLNPKNFYVVAFTAAALYFIIYLLLGVGRRA